MARALTALVVVLFTAFSAGSQSTLPESEPKAVVLQKSEGEARARRPRTGVASPATEFLLKIGPKVNGSKHLLVMTEKIHPGAAIPRHKHRGEDEVLLIQTGSARVWLGDQEYAAQPGALVFIPAGTWVSLKNTGTQDISLVAIWNEPGFEEMLLCGSVPKGQVPPPLAPEEVGRCYHHGDAELQMVPASNHKP